MIGRNFCVECGAKYWEKGEMKRFYFNTMAITRALNLDLALTPERKEYLIGQYLMGKSESGYEPKLYFDLVKNKFSHNNCPEVCAVIENILLYRQEGLNDRDNYENGVLKELLDND